MVFSCMVTRNYDITDTELRVVGVIGRDEHAG